MAYYALHKLRLLPSVFLGLPEEEKAFVCAAINLKIKSDKKETSGMKKR